ncbi:MAG TPA: 2-C-methyl-D-erythritol 4-phosphate cytidylyltransferase [Candidatus Sphingobacterium stercoripullorum]|uniref:2-C-methyl-D-erythritol 4-phosphate cytidylyltransferase n=1 Tax=Candidatus Sphingobacterium stercoripullorum TaxID=2838759 RepID=A0A9D2AZ14_9SPHI|nr:2-C-methyl-D-erythritol 4-phosphate cytidylyltransferase [Candidatus Sphingobacterium stercoripullorum]HLR49278.1 2-C-methyl-D-erythritol 4-phosphate cytidylyltransferase [Candidatus Sphingobacterium stercoripullorum]
MHHYAIIVAGGSGSRMGNTTAKQFLPLQGKPLLMYSISAFQSVNYKVTVILVLPKESITYWKNLCSEHNFQLEHHLIEGGRSRFQSVKNGITFIHKNFPLKEEDLIAVHDGARPLIKSSTITKCFEKCAAKKAVVLASRSTNSIRLGTKEKSTHTDRSTVWNVQTPQVFQAGLLLNAYQQEEKEIFTDDASVVESTGENIYLLESEEPNIKITFPQDIVIAESLLTK